MKKKASTSFLKKRSKKLLSLKAYFPTNTYQTDKSLLLLFFRKEGLPSS